MIKSGNVFGTLGGINSTDGLKITQVDKVKDTIVLHVRHSENPFVNLRLTISDSDIPKTENRSFGLENGHEELLKKCQGKKGVISLTGKNYAIYARELQEKGILKVIECVGTNYVFVELL